MPAPAVPGSWAAEAFDNAAGQPTAEDVFNTPINYLSFIANVNVSQSKCWFQAAINGRAVAKGAVAQATAIREREAATVASESASLKSNIDALARAVAALEEGASSRRAQRRP